MAKREDVYREQLKELGIYEPAFEPEISALARMERRKTRAEKAWSATAPKGQKPSFLDPLYQVVVQLEREILTHRETLGLTPKALRKLRGAPPAGPSEPEQITAKLDLIAQRVAGYSAVAAPDMEPEEAREYADMLTTEWANLVPAEEESGADEL